MALMRTNVKLRLLVRLSGVFLLGLIVLVPAAFSQNCALCYTQASASGSRMIEALRDGILVLVIPPTSMWLVIAAVAYCKRNQFKQTSGVALSGSDW
jgi:hypothetical protein